MSVIKRSVENIKDTITRSIEEINVLYEGMFINKKVGKPYYLGNEQATSTKRQDTFEYDDNFMEKLEFDQKCELYNKMYRQSNWIKRGVEVISNEVLNTHPMINIIYDEDKFEKKPKYRKQILDVKRLMENPSHEMSKYGFMKLTAKDLCVYGNAFWLKRWNKTKNKILGFIRLRPKNIKILPRIDKKTGLVYYYYLLRTSKDKRGNYQYYVYTSDNIIHFKEPDIINPLYGESKLNPLTYIAYMDINAQKYQSKFFKYGITPGCIINIEELSTEEFERLNDLVNTRYKNSKEPFTTMLLPGKAKILNDKDNLADLDLRNLRNANREEILNTIGVPPLLLSMGELQIQRQDTPIDLFMRHTITPLQQIITSTLNEQLIRRHYQEPTIKIVFGKQVVPGSKDAADYILSAMQATPMTLNEVREILGMTLLEVGGDEFFLYTPNGVVPLSHQFGFESEETEDDRRYELDAKGKPVNPQHMLTKIDFKLDKQSTTREYKLGCNNVYDQNFIKRCEYINNKENDNQITREIENNIKHDPSFLEFRKILKTIDVDNYNINE